MFVAWVTTTAGGVAFVQALAAVLPPAAAEGAPSAAVPLTLTVVFVSLAFAAAQAILPGPKSAGCAGLAIPLAGAVTLAVRGLAPSAVVSALFAGVFLTPVAYYIAIRFSIRLRGFTRRRPVAALLAAALSIAVLVQALRVLTSR